MTLRVILFAYKQISGNTKELENQSPSSKWLNKKTLRCFQDTYVGIPAESMTLKNFRAKQDFDTKIKQWGKSKEIIMEYKGTIIKVVIVKVVLI